MLRILVRSAVIASVLSLFSCSYLVDVVRYATQEDYVSGTEAKDRLMTAALVGFGVRQGTSGSGDLLGAAVGFIAARIKTDREYLNTSVKSCEEILMFAGATGQSIYNEMMAGVFCNMGPGKRPDQF